MKIQDVCEVVRGSSPRPQGDSRYYGGPVPRLMVADVTRDGMYVTPCIDSLTEEGAARSRPMKAGNLVIAVSGAPGLPAILETDACIHDGFVGLRDLDQEKVNLKFLYRYLYYVKTQSGHGAVGAIFKNLTSDQIRDLEIPLPPLPEQTRIADILDKADAIRRKRQEATKMFESCIPSLFSEMFGFIVTNSKGWPMTLFGDVGESRLGKMLDGNQQTGQHLRPYLRNTNVKWNQFDLSDLNEMDFNNDDRREFRLKYGDLLICEGGEVGRAAIWRDELKECYFQKALHRVRPKPHLAVPEYLLHFLWQTGRHGGFGFLTSQATIAHLTGVKLKQLPLPLPPLELQQTFASHLKELERENRTFVNAERDADNLFNCLVQRAFEGEL